jgi:hypothetical protein
MKRVTPFVWLLAAALGPSACASGTYALEAQPRNAALRDEYPPGQTSRTEARSRIGHSPARSLARPPAGWTDARVLDVERRTGKTVALAEQYVVPDATSFYPTLSYFWTYWDGADVLVDVVWERIGD